MITNYMGVAYSQTKWALAVRGLLGVTLGIFSLARPLQSLVLLAFVLALWALIDGITSIVRAFIVPD